GRGQWVEVHGGELEVDGVVAAHPSRRPARLQAVWGAGAETDPGPVTQQLVRDEESLQECHRPAVAVVAPAKGAAADGRVQAGPLVVEVAARLDDEPRRHELRAGQPGRARRVAQYPGRV